MNDPIVHEVWRVRDGHAARVGYDLDAIFQNSKEQEKNNGRKFVSFAPNRIEPNPSLQPTEADISASDDIRQLEATPADELKG